MGDQSPIIENAVLNEEPHRIIYYLENLSNLFHSFWNKGKEDKSLRFIDTSDVDKTVTKLFWIESLRIVLKKAFEIICIEAHETM